MRVALPLIVGLFVGLVAGFGAGFVAAFAPNLSRPEPMPQTGEQERAVSGARGAIIGPGPHGGHVMVLDPWKLHLEIVHNEHWGIVAAYPLDVEGELVEMLTPPVLCVYMPDESFVLAAVRENWDGDEDGGWHFEHDGLLGIPEAARFHVYWNDRIYTPPCRHVHLDEGAGHGPAHAHAVEGGPEAAE